MQCLINQHIKDSVWYVILPPWKMHNLDIFEIIMALIAAAVKAWVLA